MKAVNLIPVDQRRGGSGANGGSPHAVHLLLAGLAALVVMATLYVVVGNGATDRRHQLAVVTGEAKQTRARAERLAPYTQFASLSQTRSATVASLAASRFDWERTLGQLSRVLPVKAWLTSVVGTVRPGVQLEGAGGGGGTSAVRGQTPNPALEIVGCTLTQPDVSLVMTRLRLMDGVARVVLVASEKAQETAASAGAGATPQAGGGSGGDCRHGSSRYPQFQLVVFFAPLAGAVPVAGAVPTGAAK